MKMNEKGILPHSEMRFYQPSDFAYKALYHLIYSGTFYTNSDYYVNRNNWNSFLFLYVEKGRMVVKFENKEYCATEGEFIFLNCYKPHIYYSEGDSTFKWVHFAGNASQAYFEQIFPKHGCVFPTIQNNLRMHLSQLLEDTEKRQIDEENQSIIISKILYELNKIAFKQQEQMNAVVTKAISFIEVNFSHELTLEEISSHVNLSPYYFLRLFKKSTNLTPIQYLIRHRLNHAKHLLHNTDYSIKSIAFTCGFHSETHFINSFKKANGLPPNKFRNITF
ncbi:AraC family transcriptional regulator [Bacillus sp. SA1-12]|uniref:helix-turn-helix domain-containing protein n=1 Tax=Bacillus sp. SA1-12 TaxID=1455638 RepID=UPI000697003C|nr:AraC family transcriptional regulator [Bacillus sp. SA1-12]